MKVKKACYMRSLTALLRNTNPKNSSDSNEEDEPWFTAVPSITFIWIRRPQWRRRHKNRKNVKAIPVAFINSGAQEDKKIFFWETLRHKERPCSRSSTSPYETCSSRQILTESELVQNSGSQRNREVLMSKKKIYSANHKVLVCKTHSDSGLQNVRGTKLLGLTRSQKRLGVGTSINSQNTVGTLSSLEVNRSVKLLVCKALQSDNNIPKRRVTFSNYVSENAVTDTRSQISSIIMNDNEASDTSWSRRSYVRLTDNDDNCSIQTDLSCLISSIIFDDSKSSFFSVTSRKGSEKYNESNTDFNSEKNGTFFHVNSFYSNVSSCNLLSLSNNFLSDDFNKTNESSLIQHNLTNASDFGEKLLKEKLSQSSSKFNEIIPLFEIPKKGTTETLFRSTLFGVDDVKKKSAEKSRQSNLSNDVVFYSKNGEAIENETMCKRNPCVYVMEKKFDDKLSTLNSSNEIESVVKRPDDVTTNVELNVQREDDFVRYQWKGNRFETNKMLIDTRVAEGSNFKLTRHAPCVIDITSNKLEDNLSQIKIPEDIKTESLYKQTSRTNDFVKNKLKKRFIESNQIFSDVIKAKETKTEIMYNGTSYTTDVMNKKLDENPIRSRPLSDIDCLITTQPTQPLNPFTNNIAKVQSKENFIEPIKIVSNAKKAEDMVDFVNEKLDRNVSQSNPLNDRNYGFQTIKDISSRFMNSRSSYPDDFSKNQSRKNFIISDKKNLNRKKGNETKTEVKCSLRKLNLSNETITVSKKTEENFIQQIKIVSNAEKAEDMVDFVNEKLDRNVSQSNPLNDRNYGFQTIKDISSRFMNSRSSYPEDFSKNQSRKNLIISDKKNLNRKKDDETKTEVACSLRKLSLSNETISVSKKTEENLIQPMKIVSNAEKAEDMVDFVNEKLDRNVSQSNPLNHRNYGFQATEDISSRFMNSRSSYPDDFSKNQSRKNLIISDKKNLNRKKDDETKTEVKCSLRKLSLSNEIIPVSKKTEDISEPICCFTQSTDDYFVKNQWKDNLISSNQIVSDIEIPVKIQSNSKNDSIECITIELKDVSSTFKEIVIESEIGSGTEDHTSMMKNDISTDTNDLVVANLNPPLDPKSQLMDNDANNGILTIHEIFNFLQQPSETLDASLLFDNLATVGEEPFRNNDEIKQLKHVGEKQSTKNAKKIVDQVEFFRIDTETRGEYESVCIEMKDFCDEFKKNDSLEKKSCLQFHNCLHETCENSNESSKHSEIVGSSTSHFHNKYAKCSAGGKCCVVCGRRKMDNPRYIRPVCRVKGGTWSPHLEKDPWMNVMKKVVKYDNRMELLPQESTNSKNNKINSNDEELNETSSRKLDSNVHEDVLNETPTEVEKKLENIVKNIVKEEECRSGRITEAEELLVPISPVETNMPSSRADQSTNCCPPELHSSTSFGFTTFRGLRTQSAAKTYFMRKSVKTVQVTANRLLCVISESDSLMSVPPFLPKKPPNWFVRQMPTRRCSRR